MASDASSPLVSSLVFGTVPPIFVLASAPTDPSVVFSDATATTSANNQALGSTLVTLDILYEVLSRLNVSPMPPLSPSSLPGSMSVSAAPSPPILPTSVPSLTASTAAAYPPRMPLLPQRSAVPMNGFRTALFDPPQFGSFTSAAEFPAAPTSFSAAQAWCVTWERKYVATFAHRPASHSAISSLGYEHASCVTW